MTVLRRLEGRMLPWRDPLGLVRLARALPRGTRADMRLDECAAYVMLHRAFDEALPPLNWRHVLGLECLPDVWNRRSDEHDCAPAQAFDKREKLVA